MATTTKKTSVLMRAAGIGALTMMALTMPSVASAQDQGNRGERMQRGQGDGQRQWQQRERQQGQAQAQANVQQPAAAAPTMREQRRDGERNNAWRGNRDQASRVNGNGPDTRNWTPQQWEAYRGAVLEGRDTNAFRNDNNRRDQRGDGRDRDQWQGRRDDNRPNDRARWQNDRQGAYGREAWRNNGQLRGDGGNWRGGDNRSWDRGWRSNNRYDWSSYRSRNRSVFQAGRYYSPYQNYSYRRIGIGLSLGSQFYGSRYWLDDPYAYRLPEVYGPYRWVRYYDDVLLVDTYSGEVVDAIYDFFF